MNADLPRLAAIDVGTNTIRLVVAEVLPDRSYRVIDDEKVLSRLGRGLARTGKLSGQAMKESVQAIQHLHSIATGMGAHVRAVATCAVREAKNGDAFLKMVEAAGLPLEIISAEDEARLAYLSVVNAFDLGEAPVAIVDVGGGSTEVVLCSGPVIERICTLRIGAVRLAEQFDLGDGALTDEQYKRLRRAVQHELKRAMGKPPFTPHLVIGTGGTLTNLAGMVMNRGASERAANTLPFAVRGFEFQRSDLRHFLDRLRKVPARDRARVPGLNPHRADIIVPGLVIVDRIVKRLGGNRVRVHDRGIRSGLIYQMIDHLDPRPNHEGEPVDRLRGARQFAASCHHDHAHADHVLCLSLRMFDDLAQGIGNEDRWCSEESRELLHVAALLHDVGYLINYAKHHKHSYHLILHSGLWGFTRHELDIVANVARYHRGARPKATHEPYARLDTEDQDLVKRLAAILRLAVGLDRSHSQRVLDVQVVCRNGTATFRAEAGTNPSVELWGAERKSRLFEDAFGLEPRFEWVDVSTAVEGQAG